MQEMGYSDLVRHLIGIFYVVSCLIRAFLLKIFQVIVLNSAYLCFLNVS